MARMRVLVVLILALTVGSVLALATYNYVQRAPASRAVSLPTRPVVVAATDLELGAELTSGDIRVINWPANAVPKGAIEDPKQVIDRDPFLPPSGMKPTFRRSRAP